MNQSFFEITESAYWKHFLRDRRRHLGKPGEHFDALPEETKELLRKLKSSDIANVRIDAIQHMLIIFPGFGVH